MKPSNIDPAYAARLAAGAAPASDTTAVGGIDVDLSGATDGDVVTYVAANDDLELLPLPVASLTIKDEGTPLATAATSLDFVGAGVTASGSGAGKTITIPGGAAALDDLSDVVLTAPATRDRLRFDGALWRNSALIWAPMMVLDPGTGNYLVLTDTSGNAIMAEV